jgi:hypothetical protein
MALVGKATFQGNLADRQVSLAEQVLRPLQSLHEQPSVWRQACRVFERANKMTAGDAA